MSVGVGVAFHIRRGDVGEDVGVGIVECGLYRASLDSASGTRPRWQFLETKGNYTLRSARAYGLVMFMRDKVQNCTARRQR